MALRDELGLKHEIEETAHEALLSLYYTAALLRKRADEFFRAHNLTDVQYNVLMLLHYQGAESGGLTQVELSRMLLVNRANVTALIDRMEKTKLVERTDVAEDRRCHRIRLTEAGRRVLFEVEEIYLGKVRRLMSALRPAELRSLIGFLDALRGNLDGSEAEPAPKMEAAKRKKAKK